MKKLFTTIILLTLTTSAVLSQSMKDIIALPNHVTGKNFNASGEVGAQYSADFHYNSEGMLSSFEFPRINLTSQFVYDNHNLSNINTHWFYNSGYGYDFTWDQVFEFENGLLQMEYTREYEATFDNEDYEYYFYYYNDDGQLIRKEQGYAPDHICTIWTYKYDDQGRTDSVSYYISWGCPGYTCLSGIYAYHYDNDLLQEIMIEEYDDINHNYDIWYTKRQIYTYTEEGKLSSEIKQTLVDDEWVNNKIHINLYDADGKIVEQQDGTWSESLNDWDITKKVIHDFSPTDMTYTVSFYKKSGEDWVRDVFNGQTLFFEPELKWQQMEMENFWPVHQLEFTITQTVSVDENLENVFAIFPNPTNAVLFVETRHATSLPGQTYRITNLMGQTLLQGHITAEIQQIDIANLPMGMYFISVGGQTVKFVKQ
jgi:hypothetical protein